MDGGWVRFLLALSVVILDEVLQQVHPLFGLDLVHLDQVLLRRRDAYRTQKSQKSRLKSCTWQLT